MIIVKKTPGVVLQRFDTETRLFVSQEFINDNDSTWETEDCRQLCTWKEADAELIFSRGGVDEPKMEPEMVQPQAEEDGFCGEQRGEA